jgi:hypothetical protein
MFFYISYWHETSWYKKASDNPKKYNDIEAWLNQLFNIYILRRNPTSRWVDFKTIHQLDGCTQNLHMRITQHFVSIWLAHFFMLGPVLCDYLNLLKKLLIPVLIN